MNLLANNEEFRELVGKLADRMQVLIGIDVKWVMSSGQMANYRWLPNYQWWLQGEVLTGLILLLHIHSEGHLPTMEDMMRCAQDPELQELSIRYVFSNMSGYK